MSSRTPLVWLMVLSFLGFADSVYLTADHYLALPLPCSLTGGCDTVLHSAYSTLGPVPLAFLGVLYYLAVLLLTVYLYTSVPNPKIADVIFGLTVLGVLASAYFFYLQVGVIHALCMYCLGSALTSILLCGSAFWLRRRLRA